jgi:uncharacterized metal-binding protein YceD (DUF177 family)
MAGRFAHCLPVDRIRDGERIDLVADSAERKAIADRIGLLSLERFDAHVSLSRDGNRIRAGGRIRAALEQSCVITADPVGEHVDEAFELMFVPEPTPAEADEEIELSHEECDVVFYDGAAIDLGSALADTLALSIDPYPRSAGAESASRDAGIMTEEQAGPFAALARLKKGSDET